MKEKEEVLALLKKAVKTWDRHLAVEMANKVLELGLDPEEAIEKGLGVGMAEVSEWFNEGKIFLPQVLAASQAMTEAIAIFEEHMGGRNLPCKGVVVIGTVEGDIHEIGKHVVAAFLRSAGYLVYDLGKDVPHEAFIAVAKERDADVIGASALMTTTLVGQRRIVERIRQEKLYYIKTIFGGACCTSRWVDSIGGDAYCECGAQVVKRVNELLSN